MDLDLSSDFGPPFGPTAGSENNFVEDTTRGVGILWWKVWNMWKGMERRQEYFILKLHIFLRYVIVQLSSLVMK